MILSLNNGIQEAPLSHLSDLIPSLQLSIAEKTDISTLSRLIRCNQCLPPQLMSSPRSSTVLLQRSLASSLSTSLTWLGACGVSIIITQVSHPEVCLRYRRHWHQKNKLCLFLHIDVELALRSAIAVQQDPPSIATVDVAPTHDINNVQAFANQVTASVSPRPLGPSTSSTADPESVEVRNESQAATNPGIDPDAAFALPLQPLQSREFDVVPVQDTTSTQAVTNPKDPSVSCPALNPPDVSTCSSTPVHSTDGS